jgi:sodium-dependent dicarboxylate transporter 2/3/5
MISGKYFPFPRNPGFWIGLALFLLIKFFPASDSLPIIQKNMLSIIFLMAIWWMTEAIPLGITALIPLVLFPIIGIMKTTAVAPNYMHHLVFLFLGGFLIAIAFQKWNLHRRLALYTLLILGGRPRNIILAFMLSSALLSMWISNSATVILMLPIALAVIKQIEETNKNSNLNKFAMVLMLAIAYSCSIGGISTLIGTPPNIVFSGIYEKFFPSSIPLSFFNWMMLILPLSVILFGIIWYYLSYFIFKEDKSMKFPVRDFFRRKYQELGKFSLPQKWVLGIFASTAVLWIFRSDIQLGVITIPGWPGLVGLEGWVQDSTVAIGMALLLFVIQVPDGSEKQSLLHIDNLKDVPWDILLLFGGGFALAEGMYQSGLADLIGAQLIFLNHLPLLLVMLILVIFVTFLTELSSNTAVATTILPIAAAFTIELQVNPLLIMLPVTIASSCAFMLPVATPPNMIVFGSRLIKIKDMVQIGVVLNILVGLVLSFYFYIVLS